LLKRKFESLRKRLKEQGTLAGVPELVQDEEKVAGDASANMEVPNAQTSVINANGTKTGAPVAGEETEDKMSTDAADDAEAEVPKPKIELPKQPMIKNALDLSIGTVTDGGAKDPTTTADAGKDAPINPEPMEEEDGKKVPKDGGYEEAYKKIKHDIRKEDLSKYQSQKIFRERMKKFSERRSVVGSSGDNSIIDVKDATTNTMKEYLRKSKVRI